MELIDRDEAIKRLGDAHFKNYGNAIMVIRETLPVDAIPVEFIRKQMERYDKEAHKYSEENKSMLAICEIDKYNALKHILDDWQKESGEWEEYIKGTL